MHRHWGKHTHWILSCTCCNSCNHTQTHDTSCGVNRAGVHCRALPPPSAPEPIFWANLNKKNLQTFAGPFRLMFNLLLFDTVPPGISFPFLKAASQCHVVGREGKWVKLGEEERGKRKEEGNDVSLFLQEEIAWVFSLKNIVTRIHKCVSRTSSRSR